DDAPPAFPALDRGELLPDLAIDLGALLPNLAIDRGDRVPNPVEQFLSIGIGVPIEVLKRIENLAQLAVERLDRADVQRENLWPFPRLPKDLRVPQFFADVRADSGLLREQENE